LAQAIRLKVSVVHACLLPRYLGIGLRVFGTSAGMAGVQQQRPADLTLNKYSLEYSYTELQEATQDFDPEYRLGSGAFGAVFRGVQADGTEVAVKALEVPEEAGFEEEVRVLSKFRHPNLVILMGFARYGAQRFLVYELLGGGDVFKRLQRSNSEGLAFPWRQRVSAAFDAACGLSHLHHATPKVFHRDIKSANILLDRNGTAKMADFGLACLSHAKAHRVESAAGTVGYACPLYAQRHVVTEGSEVYSFGIVLLELLTASPPAWVLLGPGGTREYQFLAAHIKGEVRIAMSLADPEAHWPQPISCAVADLALRCTQIDEDQRPRFVEVVNTLRKLRDALELLEVRKAEPQVAQTPRRPTPRAMGQGAAAGPDAQMRVAPVRPAPLAAAAAVGCSPATPVQQADVGAEPPLLWSLVCTFAEGVDGLKGLPREQRSLVHRWEAGRPLSSPFKVGRLAQEDFFNTMVANDTDRSMVSREHFQIRAQEAQADGAASARGGLPCSFFLANLGRTWTTVNGALLDACGKEVQLHDGDRIALGRKSVTADGVRYTPFLQLRFELAGSVVRDASIMEPAMPAPALRAPCGARRGISIAGDVVPLFLLEAGGRGVRGGLEEERRCLVHGPRRGESEQAGPFEPLVLGRSQCASFWQRLLTEEALSELPSELLVLEAAAARGARGAELPAAVAVRSLCPAHPLRVLGAGEESSVALDEQQAMRGLERDEQRVLRHGDVIVAIPSRSHSLWLSFWDLRAPGPAKTCTAQVAAAGAGLLAEEASVGGA